MLLGVPLIATKGWGAAEVQRTYARARQLCQQLGDSQQLAAIFYGLWQNATTAGELATAYELAGQLLTIAHQHENSTLQLVANFAMGMALYYQGQFARARQHADQGLTFYDRQAHRSLAFLYGQDLEVSCHVVAGWSLWHLGYPDQAIKRSQQALSLAQELAHPFSSVIALAVAGIVYLERRDKCATQECGQKMATLSEEHGISFFHAWGSILQGWAFAEQGQTEEGLRLMRGGLAAFRLTGAKIWQSLWLALLAQVCNETGQIDGAMELIAEALTCVKNSQERFYEAAPSPQG
jgi:predicted ATPase